MGLTGWQLYNLFKEYLADPHYQTNTVSRRMPYVHFPNVTVCNFQRLAVDFILKPLSHRVNFDWLWPSFHPQSGRMECGRAEHQRAGAVVRVRRGSADVRLRPGALRRRHRQQVRRPPHQVVAPHGQFRI